MTTSAITKTLMSCPLEPQYHFYDNCKMTCLYRSKKCKHNCIQLGTTQLSDTKMLSASEILFYKASDIDGLSIKSINQLKKESITKIQNLYAFNYFLDFARTQYCDLRIRISNSNFEMDMCSSRIANLLNRYPYNIPLFRVTEEDLVLLFTDYIFEDFKNRKKLNAETDYESILCMTEEKIQKARNVLTKYLTKKEITDHEFRKKED